MTSIQDKSALPPSFRNLQILEVLASEGRPLTATEINASLNLPVPTIHRLVGNLEAEGFLSRDIDGRSYQPGPKLRQMMQGVIRFWHQNLPQRDVLIRLNQRLGETCNLSIPDGDAMLYIDRVETHWPLRIQLHIGSRVPLHATAAGKLALSQINDGRLERYLKRAELRAYTAQTLTDPDRLREELRQIRQQGYSTDTGEFVPGMIAMAVPVLDRSGQMIATVSFHAPVQRLTLDEGLKYLPDLRAAAEELAELM
ncbi:IclR family transcriptional regulator [Paracoccus sp. PS-1]|uniref:IclR family transcriptional regulator n=1 Tax=unclassified Paracoccus (in: a-proteobacteria) TaxID=2688777 RepID=UPI00048D6602|nr:MULTISPECIES: IclR family transcriptional regulator [unclassified Paracoccus (in: a-proteobacteria)]MDQ7261223.1 IclR family transcriptional regulator [Paracoccus sp. PS1]RQP05611.1 MAG: IclR family transcriptional regulator [Paracoccus sp. BP8]UFM67363.1 IclR family transcriptional regulator [Paracoccus sp. MA]